MIIKIYNKVKKDGLDSLWYRFLRLFNKKIIYNNLIEKRKYHNALILYRECKNNIISGPYKNSKFSQDNFWGIGDLGAKIIGTYEFEVQKKLVELINKYHIENFVNIGAAEGYHAVGLANNTNIKKLILYETDLKGKEILKKNFDINKISKNIDIRGEAKEIDLIKLKNEIDLNKSLILIDIEGEESSVLNNEVLSELKNSYLIIENHDFLMKGSKKEQYDEFVKNLNNNFTVEIIHNSYRAVNGLKELERFTEDEIMLLCSEGRPKLMNWFVLLPK